jgi:uncharacterized protein
MQPDEASHDGTSIDGDTADWTTGRARVLVSTCTSCGQRWYLRRARCPRCGGGYRLTGSSGLGTVVGSTCVARPNAAPSGVAPSGIALVELVEGIRVLGRCAPGLQPGTRAVLRFRAEPGDETPVPYFEEQSR